MTHDSFLGFRGGILAGDTGLAKMLTMIAVITSEYARTVSHVEQSPRGSVFPQVRPSEAVRAGKGLEYASTTLLVVPTSVLQQWEIQLNQRLRVDCQFDGHSTMVRRS
ncbi:hypothetical protein BDV11DRAFT_151953 [Aspergillus similis]